MEQIYRISDEELKQLQAAELEILIELDRICRKYQIQYSLDGGTLLGAVRHKGFIPWDDDIDVIMLREEYFKFRKACKHELDHKRFFLQDYRSDPHYRWGYAKIRRNGTELMRPGQEKLKQHSGVYIDLFVADNVPDNYMIRRFHYLFCFLIRKMQYSEVGKDAEKNYVKKILYRMLSKVPRDTIFHMRNWLAARSNRRRTELISHYTFEYPKRCRYGLPRKCFDEMVEMEFEGKRFFGFKDYHSYLFGHYGDYMTLPPKQERIPHLEIKRLKLIEPDTFFISIIIPVYNVESYIEKCLNSVLEQSYKEFECILVDDGSTDKSGIICDKFAALDSRIRVIHKKNGGLVSARKAGLKAASGQFIGCVDSDDWIEKDYFENLIKAQKETGADIVAGNHYRDIGSGSYTVYNRISTGIYDREKILSQLIYSGDFFEFGMPPSLCTKLIRKNILDFTQMNVDENIFCVEDGAVTYPSVLEADKILITDICGYHYVQHQGSITKSVGEDDLIKLKLVFDYLEETFKAKHVYSELKYQLNQWKKFILLERQIQVFDKSSSDETILSPYGGILPNSRIVIYGASFLGQTIDRYIKNMKDKCIENVLWIDRAYDNFQSQGLPVYPPEEIQNLHNEYDFVLIASVTERIVRSMKECLLGLQVPENKIMWFSKKFIQDDEVSW